MSSRQALVAITLALTFFSGCGVVVRGVDSAITGVANSQFFHQGRHGKLTEKEQEWAKIAWQYFKNNTNESTGLTNSIDKYPTTTTSHVADYLAALVLSYHLEIIEKKEFDERLSSLLDFLNKMKLFRNRLPNKVYNTVTGAMVNYSNKPSEIGWSAVDIGRLLIWLRIVRQQHPEFHEYIDKAVMRWNFCDIIDQKGSLFGGVVVNGKIKLYQEGRLGYEEYAARGYEVWGFDVSRSQKLEPYEFIKVNGVDLYHDSRDHRIHKNLAPILTMPYMYIGLEFNWDQVNDKSSFDSIHTQDFMADAAERIYKAQQQRYEQQRIMTARTEHILSKPPYFLYDSIFAAGYAWNTVADDGKSYPDLSLVSVKAGFALWALWSTSYTDELMLVIEELYNPKRGWYEGRYEISGGYERSISSSTNAVVLEALYYKKEGKLFSKRTKPTYGEIKLHNIFEHPQKCFPALYGDTVEH